MRISTKKMLVSGIILGTVLSFGAAQASDGKTEEEVTISEFKSVLFAKREAAGTLVTRVVALENAQKGPAWYSMPWGKKLRTATNWGLPAFNAVLLVSTARNVKRKGLKKSLLPLGATTATTIGNWYYHSRCRRTMNSKEKAYDDDHESDVKTAQGKLEEAVTALNKVERIPEGTTTDHLLNNYALLQVILKRKIVATSEAFGDSRAALTGKKTALRTALVSQMPSDASRNAALVHFRQRATKNIAAFLSGDSTVNFGPEAEKKEDKKE